MGVVGEKKRTHFGAHPCPKKGANSQEFLGYVRSSELRPVPKDEDLRSGLPPVFTDYDVPVTQVHGRTL